MNRELSFFIRHRKSREKADLAELLLRNGMPSAFYCLY